MNNKMKTNEKTIAPKLTTGDSSSVLASMFRQILFDLGVTNAKFNMMLERHTMKLGGPNNIKETSGVRRNLKKELLKNSLSWKVFVKAIIFLGCNKFDITITLHHNNDTVTTHTKSIELGAGNESNNNIKNK